MFNCYPVFLTWLSAESRLNTNSKNYIQLCPPWGRYSNIPTADLYRETSISFESSVAFSNVVPWATVRQQVCSVPIQISWGLLSIRWLTYPTIVSIWELFHINSKRVMEFIQVLHLKAFSQPSLNLCNLCLRFPSLKTLSTHTAKIILNCASSAWFQHQGVCLSQYNTLFD